MQMYANVQKKNKKKVKLTFEIWWFLSDKKQKTFRSVTFFPKKIKIVDGNG